MHDLSELKRRLTTERPANWEEFPDIDLYKDQVLSYMTRQHTLQRSGDELTGSMINNYIKSGVLPRTTGKRYTREHVAYLTIICILKQVLSVADTDFLIKQRLKDADISAFYGEYRALLDDALTVASGVLEDGGGDEELTRVALSLAVSSYVCRLTCEHILDILRGGAEEEPAKPKEKSKEKEKEKSETPKSEKSEKSAKTEKSEKSEKK